MIDHARAPLTDKQAAIYKFIANSIASGRPPTVRDIAREFDIASPNGAMCHLKALAKKGYIHRDKRLSRSIRIDGPHDDGSIPLVGRISAGGLFEAVENVEPLNLRDLFAGADFAAVADRSLERAHVAEGDLIVFARGRCVGMIRRVGDHNFALPSHRRDGSLIAS